MGSDSSNTGFPHLSKIISPFLSRSGSLFSKRAKYSSISFSNSSGLPYFAAPILHFFPFFALFCRFLNYTYKKARDLIRPRALINLYLRTLISYYHISHYFLTYKLFFNFVNKFKLYILLVCLFFIKCLILRKIFFLTILFLCRIMRHNQK